MIVLDPGHVYELDNLDDPDREVPRVMLYFVKREGEGFPGNVGHHAGTTAQEVLRVLIDRVKYVDQQIPDPANDRVLKHLRDAIWELEVRAAKRRGTTLPKGLRGGDTDVEDLDVCPACGHIACREDHTRREEPEEPEIVDDEADDDIDGADDDGTT